MREIGDAPGSRHSFTLRIIIVSVEVYMYELMNGDCMELLKEIEPGSIDLILTDIPYGTMNSELSGPWLRKHDKCEWDVVLPIGPMFELCARVLRPNGRAILFSQEPLTSKLIQGAIPSLPFNYRAIWEKDHAGNSLMSGVAMVSLYEDINIFTKCGHDYEGANPLRSYFAQVLEYIGLHSAKEINAELGHRKAEHVFYVTQGKQAVKDKIGGAADHATRTGSSQFALCTEAVYNELIEHFNINEMDGFRPYAELKETQTKFSQSIGATFNRWQGGKSKSNILKYNKPVETVHPTQKPVELLEDLILTFSNKGDKVLDFTMGSGSTIEAAINTGRDAIGIELDTKYYNYVQKRAKEAASRGPLWFI